MENRQIWRGRERGTPDRREIHRGENLKERDRQGRRDRHQSTKGGRKREGVKAPDCERDIADNRSQEMGLIESR